MPFKKITSISLLVFFLSISLVYSQSSLLNQDSKNPVPIVCFTPGQDCTQLIVEEINKAKREIQVQAYSFTSMPIAKALVSAFKRRVKVQIILDKSQKTAKFSELNFFIEHNIPTYIDDAHAIAHNKIIIIDSEVLISGSFNFTKAAQEKNAENLIVIKDPHLTDLYQKNYFNHLKHSQTYNSKTK